MTLPAYGYRDPLEVLQINEGMTCKGCKHIKRIWDKDYCHLGVSSGDKMRKCSKYDPKGKANV